jgi:hypothetical protein
MKRIGIIGLCFAAVLAFSSVVVASATAAMPTTELLFSTATGSFTATGGEGILLGASQVKCLTNTASGTIETAHLGKASVVFEKCTTSFLGKTDPCQSSGAKPEEIVVSGPFHLNLATTTLAVAAEPEPHAAIDFLVEPAVEFTCTGAGTVKVTGSVIGLIVKGGKPIAPGEALEGSEIVFKSEGTTTKQEDVAFLLALASNALDMAELSCEIFKVSGSCSQMSTGKITKTTPAGATLVTG